ncbi:sigma-54 interaction domain-containing protein [Aneurinibacillus aneurinilyticus]|uniref:sigma-54 interaction domain-containing protein n=1 Tax=Aneurinibacillus aneurinilyticus TaxID=1391 RepID=UPI0023F43795|nr:sigma 54-interacting transcriptional regulator [Aneurinibacillus aneurinilyticus]
MENQHHIHEHVNLLLFVSSTYKIKMILGHYENVFATSTSDTLSLNKDVTTLEWDRIFMEKPNFDLDEQILFTKNGQKILFSITKISTNDFEFIISLTNITRCIKIHMQQSKASQNPGLNSVVFVSEKMQELMDIAKTIAHVNSTVLLLGESGVGKSLLARKIHALSPRASEAFVSLNCASLPKDLIESELFGYEQGTFTGGNKAGKIGLFEAANNGTIFLDEIAELPYDMQSKLLDVLQEGTIRKIGGVKAQKIDVRVIAATNKNLPSLVEKNLFRKDLFYRLNVVPLELPALKNRKEDIPLLIDYFLANFNRKYNQHKMISEYSKAKLMDYDWPGNIRELENIIERMVVTNTETVVESLPRDKTLSVSGENTVEIKGIIPLKEAKKLVEKDLVLKAYKIYGSTYKAAKVLKVDQSTIVRKLQQYNEVVQHDDV